MAAPPPRPVLKSVERIVLSVPENIGEVAEGPESEFEVPILNRSENTVSVVQFQADCDQYQVTPQRFEIPAHGSATIWVKKDLTPRSANHLGREHRPFSLTLNPVIAGDRNTIPLTVRGTIVSRVTLNQLGVYFGELDASSRIGLTATLAMPLEGLTAEVDDKSISVECKRLDDRKYRIGVTANPNGKPGDFTARIRLFETLPNGFKGDEVARFPVQGSWVAKMEKKP